MFKRLFSPPEIPFRSTLPTILFSARFSFKFCIISSSFTFFSCSLSLGNFKSTTNQKFSLTVKTSIKISFYITKPKKFLNYYQERCSPFNLTSPVNRQVDVLFIFPDRTFKRVDFPAPEPPIIAKHSPLFANPDRFFKIYLVSVSL